ncbi:MAG: hypothetical protein J6I68_01840 [Butyrivibrio sp.]|uniref:hypothetical protein n=1 Tax=Butyrivibrio sp. TaxID=28121 RepID=UPI001B017CBC|nr:hypothetical protein [Butyrivibrio sp.]MBO5623094.1 hypothetical protein [Butyrivibrio sp.]MBP3274412.1 hypothetical protein [Butyrivibrio sp.]MBP3781965.1 hypothetical protein [Butyrivibrio sp.]MBP3814669.1 hypothetical protein [Butyrivibrio sp.]
MNNFLNNMERKFGKYAIRNITVYIIGLYIFGYILQFAPFKVNITNYLTLDPYLILHGQVWRLVTWILIPPQALSIWIFFTLYLYYFMGTTMERTIGTFRYNVFIFGGIIFMILSAFLTYLVYYLITGGNEQLLAALMYTLSGVFSTYYIQEAVFLIFAICYPDIQLLLMFIIPIKVKYLGILYAGMLAFSAIYNGLIGRNYAIFFAVFFQFLNVFLFYLSLGRLSHLRPKEIKRRQEFNRGVKMRPQGVTRHKCAVCGRTEETNPELEFRFCSKCNGNYEYCQDHLFTHQHVK